MDTEMSSLKLHLPTLYILKSHGVANAHVDKKIFDGRRSDAIENYVKTRKIKQTDLNKTKTICVISKNKIFFV